ncbi:MAG TPA: SDR family oxidoreductase [Candidatus Limnocylindrales bacterium]|nr:SDR family oxidoreductase [Candidatus Limnocylindrales bacterium]
MSETSRPAGRVAVLGASGYVGGRLLRPLLNAGFAVRAIARRPEYLVARVPSGVEVVRGDAFDRASLVAALKHCEFAYYLVHSMSSSGSFEEQDREAATSFASAAAEAGVRRIVYLGGLGDDSAELSTHLRSRHETGRILRESPVPTIEFRASVVIGSGSLSFEMVRALTERLPVMITPRWVRVPAQPIAIADLISYLVTALTVPAETSRIFEIGGADVVSYGGIMQEYARQRGLRRAMIPFPLLTPWLSSLWLGFVTPLYARIGRKLIESIVHPTIVRDDSATRVFGIKPMGLEQAISSALVNEDNELAETRWSDALSAVGRPTDPGSVPVGNRLIDSRTAFVPVPPAAAFAPIRRIGGARGWYHANWLWRIRGILDMWMGGVGMRRGRRDPEKLRAGDALDWWRVEAFEPDRRLVLYAEMKVPGRAWLEFEVTPAEGGSIIRQTAMFDPAGLAGLAYWYGVYPLHAIVFQGMLDSIAERASEEAAIRVRR